MEFEKYHPIMTAHYVLDWLTTYKVKDVFALRHDASVAQASGRSVDTDIMATAAYVNHMMSLVMNNNALIWGVGDKVTNDYLGTFMLWDVSEKSAAVGYELLPAMQQQGVMGEVLTHMISFAFDELHLQQLIADTASDNAASQALLVAHGFTRQPDFNREDATVSGTPQLMWRFVLNAKER
ncbi:GNAT family N-acetyltransferase [Furfurilactobacillus siliginis]|uniref:Alanine acetyl transferase n=1 Tax=Furfurilactobacillus siliginis TaxID=348151 RepID=A0A0R2LDX0_9LACO|nr:GNAT family N-acetyltransferase [Furfurilactobacillus siliginis]KRN96436.1 alanine acetyl transferase [Furfurilactobacillus siliginis]GEK29646.1 alanine acetyltransferase [Furfurilactobacillus siliginis]